MLLRNWWLFDHLMMLTVKIRHLFEFRPTKKVVEWIELFVDLNLFVDYSIEL